MSTTIFCIYARCLSLVSHYTMNMRGKCPFCFMMISACTACGQIGHNDMRIWNQGRER